MWLAGRFDARNGIDEIKSAGAGGVLYVFFCEMHDSFLFYQSNEFW